MASVQQNHYFCLGEFYKGGRDYRPVLRFRDTLGAFFRDAAKWKRVEIFKFVISENQAFFGERNGTLFKSEVQKFADSYGAQAIKLEFVVLTDRSTPPDIFLECIADFILIGGFDTSNPKSKNDIQWLGDAVLKSLLAKFT